MLKMIPIAVCSFLPSFTGLLSRWGAPWSRNVGKYSTCPADSFVPGSGPAGLEWKVVKAAFVDSLGKLRQLSSTKALSSRPSK